MGATSEHFPSAELMCKCGCQQNGCTQGLVDMLERFRAAAGNIPVHVDDAYRCPEHNQAVGGATHSQHVLGNAADVSIEGHTAAQLESIAWRTAGIHGLGRDDQEHYVHLDVRETPFTRWCYNRGEPVPYYSPAAAPGTERIDV